MKHEGARHRCPVSVNLFLLQQLLSHNIYIEQLDTHKGSLFWSL